MAFTFGFYNSVNSDRRYDAIQLSSIFDGVIKDGVFMSIGTQLMVKATVGMMINVGIGRAWFNHTWSLNDALLPLVVDPAEVLQDRIDVVVLEIDARISNRENFIHIVKGTPSSTPQPPELMHTVDRHQYPLANIYVVRNSTSIIQSNITNRVGTEDTPFVTGLLDVVHVDDLVLQWKDEWRQFFNKQVEDINNTNNFWKDTWLQYFTAWRDQLQTNMENTASEMLQWRQERETAFDEWFNALQTMLEGDAAANMAAQILELQSKFEAFESFKETLSNEFAVVHDITDSSGDRILDSDDRELEGRIIFCIRPCSI